MAKTSRQMHLGVYVMGTGHHVAGWRMKDAQAGAENLDLLVHAARTAERGKFDLFFLADALNTGPTMHPSILVRLEPLTLLSALAMCTSRIGLAATASTTYTEPYNLARYFASLDHISRGRAGWNVVTGAFPEAAANFGRDKHPPHEKRYAIAAEFVTVVQGPVGQLGRWRDPHGQGERPVCRRRRRCTRSITRANSSTSKVRSTFRARRRGIR